MDERAAFVFRQDHRLETARKDGVVAIGWHKLEGLVSTIGWDEIKAGMVSAYPHLYADNKYSLGNAAGSVWRFVREMKEGDLVLVPVRHAFWVAEIEGPVDFNSAWATDTLDMAWHRRAKWLASQPITRDSVTNTLQMRLKSRQTIVDASDCLHEVLDRLNGRSTPSAFEFVRAGARGVIVNALTNLANDRQLEEIVAELLRAEGAISARVLPKRQNKPGDFDVVAEWAPIAGAKAFRIAVQVKQHQGQSGIEGIRQLIDRAPHEDVDRLMFVTTAEEVEPNARLEADKAGVCIIARDDLADWISSRGLLALAAGAKP